MLFSFGSDFFLLTCGFLSRGGALEAYPRTVCLPAVVTLPFWFLERLANCPWLAGCVHCVLTRKEQSHQGSFLPCVRVGVGFVPPAGSRIYCISVFTRRASPRYCGRLELPLRCFAAFGFSS